MTRKKKGIKNKCLVVGIILLIMMIGLVIWKNNLDSNFRSKVDVNLPDDEIVTRLTSLEKEDERILLVLQNYDEYPEELLGMLSRNVDMLDFVLGYPEKKGTIYEGTIGEVKRGDFPLLLQYDERWGYAYYGDSSIAVAGCAPTALSMVIVGLTGNNKVTPYTVSKYAYENGYYLDGVGTKWDLMTKGSKHFGVRGEEINLSRKEVYNSLENGHPIICSMRPGDFTTEGHFIVLTGIQDGKIKVNDPNSRVRSNKLWDYETLEYQIKALWSYSKIK